MTEEQFRSARARYAAKVVLVDRWLGRLLDTMDRLDLWQDTLVVFTTDHGTYNGDHGRMGKMQTHLHDASAHIPFIIAHPTLSHGERRQQLVQLVDIYPTVPGSGGPSYPAGPSRRQPAAGAGRPGISYAPVRPQRRLRQERQPHRWPLGVTPIAGP